MSKKQKQSSAIKYVARELHDTDYGHHQRQLKMFVRALWGGNISIDSFSADKNNIHPYISNNTIYLPDKLNPPIGIPVNELYIAMIAHASGHILYQKSHRQSESIDLTQRFFIGFVEDARIEYNVVQTFPGMKVLWRRLLLQNTQYAHPILLLLNQMALLLLDNNAQCKNKALKQFSQCFHERAKKGENTFDFSMELGLELYKLLNQNHTLPEISLLNALPIAYRDDNHHLWSPQEQTPNSQANKKGLRPGTSQQPSNGEIKGTTNNQYSDTITLEDGHAEVADSITTQRAQNVLVHFRYPEWDYQNQAYRPNWTTVYEWPQPKSECELIERILHQRKAISAQLKKLADILRTKDIQRVRGLEHGDEVDLNTAVEAAVALRSKSPPNTRVMMRKTIHHRSLAVIVLLDLSESTNDKIPGGNKTILELTRESATLIGEFFNHIGDHFALHGFSSSSRHEVHYHRFKDFRQAWNSDVKASLAGMQGGLSTRMGAAIRHASDELARQQERKKLLLIISDGEPADIDEHDPHYLHLDAKAAVEEASNQGIVSFCLALDPKADHYVKRIFGLNHYSIVDKVERLPEKLPALFARLGRT